MKQTTPGSDPGFPVGWGPDPQRRHHHDFTKSSKKLYEIEKSWGRRGATPLDPSLHSSEDEMILCVFGHWLTYTGTTYAIGLTFVIRSLSQASAESMSMNRHPELPGECHLPSLAIGGGARDVRHEN